MPVTKTAKICYYAKAGYRIARLEALAQLCTSCTEWLVNLILLNLILLNLLYTIP